MSTERRAAGDPHAADHASFDSARRMNGVAKVCNRAGVVFAMFSVFAALTWPPLTWGLWTLPAWRLGGRPLGAFLTGWNKRMHPCIVDLFYRLFGVKMFVYGATARAEPVYFMANHQHYHDNVTVVSAMAARVSGVSGAGIRWLAKRALMLQPLGWSMYLSGEVMLSRAYDQDKRNIADAVRGLASERHFPNFGKTSWLVVFPEGTRITPKQLSQSQAFMEAKNMGVRLEHLICPRFKGTQMILREGRQNFAAVYDVTIGYKPLPKHNNWRMPSEVHVHLERIPIELLPEDDDEVAKWLLGRWAIKDELLAHFYKTGRFPGEQRLERGSLLRSVWTLAYTVAFNLVLTVGWCEGVSLQNCLIAPELQWQSRGKCRFLLGNFCGRWRVMRMIWARLSLVLWARSAAGVAL
jgi:1-acyl-sn-glycerol-3-phosphate acyltransferase